MSFEKIPWAIKVRAFFVSSGGFLLDGYDLSVISFASTIIAKEFSLTSAELGLLVSSSLIGMIPGSIIFGYLADKIGRKRLMGFDLLFFLVFGILTAISNSFTSLFLSRLFLGFGIGGDYPISSTIMSEFSPSLSRGKYLVGSVSMYWIGTAISALFTLLFLPTGEYFWRYVFLVGAIISLPIVLLRIKLIESPRWLVAVGKEKGEKELQVKGATSFTDIFKGRLLLVTFFVTSVWFLFDVASYGIGLYYPYLLEHFAFPSKYEVVLGTLAISVGAIIGYIIAINVVDPLGRRPTLITGLSVMSVLLYLGSLTHISGSILVPYFMTFVAFEQWAGAVTLFYPTELYPTSVRASGQGFATAISRIGGVLGTFYFPILEHHLGFTNVLMLFGSLSLLADIISIVLAKETSRKPLEETSISV
ncbi:MFS transporter [Sulfurisphaera ohwakuensis]|uniref:MFS family permease n=1 Tax=Sulfurisphaera ohwakuensis TaxID=69656 RepID=A0A650CKQ3_SULOH|nr:MFS transporter [Sulfurisphaera ohwakuensis]MBB5253689.1 MFS family permease [Sulfurisphaera ohwakuensis]QGR18328.1 MFS transporter [Sulfurisphaera ohwakuensis]